MFFKNTKKESTIEVRNLKETIESMKKIALGEKNEYEKKISNIIKDNAIIIARKEAELDVKISEKTKILTDKVSQLTLENGNYKKEVEILTKAFENLGFDVKDMKEILTKLVDGIVSKNTIQLVK